ncbi:MAG TPA: HNH endonuclease [Flavobacterium sp.]|nr:HNH endonuclease [Flavobacterium sp.]
MFRPYPSEEFKEIPLDTTQSFRYALSSRGRMIRFTETFLDGDLYEGCLVSGYRVIFYKTDVDGKNVRKHIYIYKLFADYFIPKTSDEQQHVLHLDYNRSNDNPSNLKWATREEKLEHSRKSPHVIQARNKIREKTDGQKLTATQVMRLKKMLLDPNRKTRMRIIAKQFGVSEMQLHRIKTGENWGHIKV